MRCSYASEDSEPELESKKARFFFFYSALYCLSLANSSERQTDKKTLEIRLSGEQPAILSPLERIAGYIERASDEMRNGNDNNNRGVVVLVYTSDLVGLLWLKLNNNKHSSALRRSLLLLMLMLLLHREREREKDEPC